MMRIPSARRFLSAFIANSFCSFLGITVWGARWRRICWMVPTLFSVLHGYFDRILLGEASIWFGDQSRKDLYHKAIERGLREKAVPHGEVSRVYIEHLFFRGKLPRFLGFDYSFANIGSRSTVSQAGLFKGGALAPTFRMICDFGEDVLHANVAGGASDRRFFQVLYVGVKGLGTGGL